MKKFEKFTGVVCPLDRANVDTDAIIPKQFLKSIKRTGFGPNLFDEWRYLDHGEPGMDNSTRPINPDFVLNDPRYAGASILLARENFGCGSSREHAPWALADYGFRVIIAPSFADIFFSNCFKNGILPIVLDGDVVDRLFQKSTREEALRIEVDLEAQRLRLADGEEIGFDVDPFRKHCLLEGLDDIGLTLQHVDEIKAYEERRRAEASWLFKTASGLRGIPRGQARGMMRYSSERKEAVLKKMLPPANKTIKEIAREEGISEATLYNWRKAARAEGRLLPDGDATPTGWSSADKFAAVLETAALNEAELSEYCRQRGLYPAQIEEWRAACEQANDWDRSQNKRLTEVRKRDEKRIRDLERDLKKKEKALAETAALLVLSKKLEAIWGDEEK